MVSAESGLAVASLAEAWIETTITSAIHIAAYVASLAEAWIETDNNIRARMGDRSPPSRRRGLKLRKHSIQLAL